MSVLSPHYQEAPPMLTDRECKTSVCPTGGFHLLKYRYFMLLALGLKPMDFKTYLTPIRSCTGKGGYFVKRLFDVLLVTVATIFLAVPIILVAVCVRLTSKGPAIYWSQRVGQHNRLFNMPKFRTMKTHTPAVVTHLLANAKAYLTPIGSFLRKSSLDELPQL